MDNKLEEGVTFEYAFKFSQDDVQRFAEASGDFNPIHLDSTFAKESIFGRTIIHGFLGGSVFSKVFGTIFPGHGTIYLKQSMSFYKPMFVDEKYSALFSVKEVLSEKSRAWVKTEIKDQKENVVISGEALIQHDEIR